MKTKVLRINKLAGTAHDSSPDDWDNASPVLLAGTAHDSVPGGGLTIHVNGEQAGKINVRSADNGDLLLELNV